MTRNQLLVMVIVSFIVPTGCFSYAGLSKPQSGSFVRAVDIVLAKYLVLDLTSGSQVFLNGIPDLETNPSYRQTKMVFRSVPTGVIQLGSAPGSFGAQSDEMPRNVSMRGFFIGVFEVTQAQWQALTATTATPWAQVNAVGVVGTTLTDPRLPAWGISLDAATAAASAASARLHAKFDLPTDDQWEYACRAGATTAYCWGDALDSTTASAFARTWETSPSGPQPSVVGTRLPNGYGLYDMHGNVWELTKSGTIRGGSWHDSLSQARCANKIAIDGATGYATGGLRLVVYP